MIVSENDVETRFSKTKIVQNGYFFLLIFALMLCKNINKNIKSYIIFSNGHYQEKVRFSKTFNLQVAF